MKILKKWKQKWAVLFLVCGCVLGGCGEKPEGEVPGNLQPANIAGNQNNSQQGAAGTQGNGQQGTAIPEGQILDQSFTVSLDGWGEVVFAPFEPEYDTKINEEGELVYGEVRFMLLKDGEVVCRFPGFEKDNIRLYVQDFQQVTAVAFKDYNEDGRTDVLVITESVYIGDDPEPSCEARAYTQEEGSKEFIMDMPVTEYLWEKKADSMDKVDRALEDYSKNYSASTSKTAWETWQGIMLGNGCVWIGETLDENRASQGLKVIGLNRLANNAQASER